jgi:hypothetical protein
MFRILVAATLIFACLVVAKREAFFQRAHVVGGCNAAGQTGDGGEWRSCRAGFLTDRPSLKLDGCTSAGVRGEAELWRCPARLGALQS